jgi:transcriptional regulator with XRE-family HTH domain
MPSKMSNAGDTGGRRAAQEERAPAVLADLGRRVAGLRQRKGWSQSELAQRLGVTRQRLAHWELGVHSPPVCELLALARELGVSLDELVTGEAGPPSGISREQKDEAMSHIAALVRLLRLPGEINGRRRPGGKGHDESLDHEEQSVAIRRSISGAMEALVVERSRR